MRLADRLLELGMADPVVGALSPIDPSQLTFVVPSHERPELLDRLLASIEPGRRIIVVDDCSANVDKIATVAASYHADLEALPANVGPAAVRNAGLRRVKTPFVAFVDDDVVLDRDCVPSLLRHFNDPKMGLVAPRVGGLGSGPRGTWIQRYENARSSLDLGPTPSTVRPYAPVAWVPAACVVARVEAIRDGFSADLRKGEDVDLVWRLVDQGWRVRYEPSAHVYHENRAGTRQWLSRKAFYGSSADLLAQRHPRKMAPAVLAPWSAGVAISLLAQRKWSLPLACLLSGIAAVQISKKVARSNHPVRLGVALTADGVIVALWQASGLLLRHWWPATAVACCFSKRTRRAVLVVGMVDAAVEYWRTSPQLDPLRFGVARRLDDIAYGFGLWLGAIRGRSLRALLPDIRIADHS
jgi:mycofactocin glycosyltransferase